MTEPIRNILPEVPYREWRYADYRNEAEDCDVLLWEPTSWYGRVIAAGTGGPFSHVSAALWWERRLMSIGYEEGKDGVVEPLRSAIRRAPGKVSVFRVSSEHVFDAAAVKNRMIRDLGGKYQWGNIRRLAMRLSPLCWWLTRTKWFRQRVEDASHNTAGGICSQFIARSFGEDEVMFVRKHSSVVTPNDLGLSPILDYLGTLV